VSELGALAYRIVDVFTDQAFTGNPLAVVLEGDELTAEQMQRIAAEFNLSETTFPIAASTSDADYRLRIFTPEAELPFAGHPSIGSAWVMRSLGRVSDGRIVQECGAGLLPLLIDGDSATLTGGTAHLGDVVADPATVVAAVGLTAADLVGDPLRWAGVGLDFGFLHVRPDAVARAVPDLGLLRGLDAPAGVSVFSYADGAAHARIFAAGVGVTEDPATGSAALGLGVWLASCGHVAADGETSYVVSQGIELGRPSRLDCVVRCEGGVAVECRVTGSVVPIAEGHIRHPAV
jgi:trans-2,3-dihydro-3-hydroxyanthranilate isomerase